MATENLVSDTSLLPLLHTSQATLAQAESMIKWLEENAALTSSPVDAHLGLAKRQTHLSACLAKLRGQHRRATFDARATKQETAEAKQEVNRLLLQLQNLYYEQRHLMGEIAACEGYDHAYMHLPLLSLDKYLALFPDQVGLSEQELMPVRIEHERQEREKMEQQRLELVKIKDNLLKENGKQKEELRKMDEKLEAMIDTLGPLEEALTKDI
ncbi:hypothetical protein DV736_g5215, partial [Chaetothyriales sp. CBS 134916]